MRIALQSLLSWCIGFFIAGALLFPLFNPFYLGRVVVSLGIVGVLNGLESVLRAGHISTCGFLSGNCSEHSVRFVGLLLAAIAFGVLEARHRARAP